MQCAAFVVLRMPSSEEVRKRVWQLARQGAAHVFGVLGRGQVDPLGQAEAAPGRTAERDDEQRVARVEADEEGQGRDQLAGIAHADDGDGGCG